MGNHREKRIRDHWGTSKPGLMKPIHPIARFMSHETFEQLYHAFRPYDPRGSYDGSFARILEWTEAMQAASLRYWTPGTNIAIDECIQHFEGRTLEKVVIPSKPTPEGFKIWAVAEAGYFLQWLPHLPSKVFDSIGDNKPRTRKRKRDDEYSLNPTQAVVVNLVKRLPPAIYHVFLDNLFSSPDLFTVLRTLNIGATGTCRINSGIFKGLVQLKKADTNGKLHWHWGQIETVPTPDNKVNQIAWKDNALVLLLSTVYEGTEFTTRIRKRPTTTHARARAIKHFFGAESVKEARVLSAAADYNDHMGAVDRGDQLRQQEGLEHRICKGPWRALAWGFLLETALTNTFLLQKNGQPNWKPLRTLHEWREQVCSDLLREYGHKAGLRKLCRAGDTNTPSLQHKRVSRGKSSPCKGCQGVRVSEAGQKPLRERSHNRRPTQTRSGCETCDVAICNRQACWDFYHELN
uniref:PiggyBac transposable element-derived protein domain-containing protein n=1 Tax=Bionectria ochroleuca TaxID=29856 RepID=A0A8H7K3B7_BIOOC